MERNIELISSYLLSATNKSINKELVRKRFSKATETYHEEAQVQKQIAIKMANLISNYIHEPCQNILEIGCGTGFFSYPLATTIQPENFILNDLCPEMENNIKKILDRDYEFIQGDAEIIPFPGNLDGIFSCSTFQWFLDINNFFSRCHTALNTNAYLAFSTFGKENMKEVTSITGKGLFYHSKKELEKMLNEKYELIHTEEEKIELLFNSPMEVLRHLKLTGVTGVGTMDKPWNRQRLIEFCKQYKESFENNNCFPLTYHPIYMIWKKRELPSTNKN